MRVLHPDATGAWLGLDQAAAALGVSVDTVQRRRKAGSLDARQEPTPSGFRWRVYVPHPAPAPEPAAPARAAAPAAVLPPHAALAEYAQTLTAPLVATIERQATELGTLRARVAALEQAAAPRRSWWAWWRARPFT